MNTLPSPAQPQRRPGQDRGFALVITMSLVVLLMVIGVGLLSLSSVALRAGTTASARERAMSNARLALLMAIGELQRTTGPDQRATAPADQIDPAAPRALTGVWTGRDPRADSLTRKETDPRFAGWLVSHPDPKQLGSPQTPPRNLPDSQGTVILLGNGSLGNRQQLVGDEQRLAAASVPITHDGLSGAYSWAVIDESIKSRADLYQDPAAAKLSHANVCRAGAPPADGLRVIKGWESFKIRPSDNGKLVSQGSIPVSGLVTREFSEAYSPDTTVHSRSLFTDPVNGGFKADLSLLASRPLSAAELSSRLYRDSGALTGDLPSDPLLAQLTNYHQLYKSLGTRNGNVSPSAWQVAAKLPADFNPYDVSGTTCTVNRKALPEPVLAPSVLRIDMIFSMVTRMTHGGWRGTYGADRYLLHMQYLPVVTLHNPYNVPLAFEGMRVTFKNMPVGFNFMVDGQQLSTRLVALNQMYVGFAGNDTASKDFGITLVSSIGSSGSSSMVLQPGQTKLFGMPKVAPTWTWFSESPGVGADGTHLFDWRNDKTANFQLAPTMLTTSNASAAGFDIDWINPQPLHTAKGTEAAGGNRGMVRLFGAEQLGVQFGPYAPPAGGGAFSVAIDLIQGGAPLKAGAFNVRYGTQDKLNELLAKGTSARYPKARTFPATYPRPGEDPPINVASIYEDGNTPLRDYVMPKPFMIFSLAAKTTLESFQPSRTLIAGNPAANIIDADFTRDPEASVPIEMVMMPITPGLPPIEENRAQQEGYFFSGNGSQRGTPRATIYELPAAPLQSLAQFRHANLANSGYSPFTTYTVGESFAHPIIGTAATRNNWTDGSVALDHSFLANRALWDRYFLSTIADQSGPLFGTSPRTASKVLTDFFEAGGTLPNARLLLYNPTSNKTPRTLNDFTAGSPAYQSIAAYLMLQGGFNINSTSVEAWAAALAALQEAPIDTELATETGSEDRFSVPRTRRPSEKSIDAAALGTRQNRWQGYRQLTKGQIRELATSIVKEIRARGPFLSLADFVNRKIGDEGDSTVVGAIQAAIDSSSVNDKTKVDGREITVAEITGNSYGYKSTRAGSGNSATAAPGMLTQGDVLSLIGSRITARADTFLVRAYGEARDAGGRVVARAWCEATLQRFPEYVDGSNKPVDAATKLVPANRKFGRRYQVTAFRWLPPSEV